MPRHLVALAAVFVPVAVAFTGCSKDRGEASAPAPAPAKAVEPGAGVVSASELGPRPARVIPVSSKSPEAMSRFSAGRELQENVRMVEAAEEFRAAVEADPDFALAFAYLATVTRGEESERAAGQATRLANDLPEAERALVRGLLAARRGARDEADKLYRRVAMLNPSDWRAHKLVGDMAMRTGRSDEAIVAYGRATELNPRAAEPHNNLAYLHADEGRHADALEAARRYVELRPDQPNPLDSLGEIYLRANRLDDAERAFARALELTPTWSVSHSGIGVVRAYRGDWEGAVESFEAYAEGAQRSGSREGKGDELRFLMWAHVGAGNLGEAQKLARRYAESSGKEYLPAIVEVEVALLEGDANAVLKKARRLERLARKDEPREGEPREGEKAGWSKAAIPLERALAARVYAEVALDRADRAERVMERLAKLSDDAGNPGAYHYFAEGMLALGRGQYERALERLERVSEREVGPVVGPLAQRARIRALRALGRESEATELHSAAMTRRQRDPLAALATSRLLGDDSSKATH